MLDVRKLAALDIHFLGPTLILAEFAVGVVGPLVFGALTLRIAQRHSWSWAATLFGSYLFALGVNYLPLLLHAVALVRNNTASAVIADELSDKAATMAKYRRQSLYLLLPLVVPMVAMMQERKRRNDARLNHE